MRFKFSGPGSRGIPVAVPEGEEPMKWKLHDASVPGSPAGEGPMHVLDAETDSWVATVCEEHADKIAALPEMADALKEIPNLLESCLRLMKAYGVGQNIEAEFREGIQLVRAKAAELAK